MPENLKAELSKLQSNLAAKKHDTERNPPKKPKSREGGVRKTSPAMKRREGAKGEKDIGKGKFLVSRGPHPTESATAAVRKRKYSDPINKRLKDLIACLLETRKDMTKEEICTAKQLDHDDGELWEAAMNNPRIEVLKDIGRFRYLPRHASVTNKGKLLMHVRRHPHGTAWSEISDTYVGVEADLGSLVEERKVFVIENPDLEDKVIFWNDPTVEEVKLSEEVLEMWKETQPPSDDRLLEELMSKSELPPAPRKASRKREPVQKVPKERKSKDFKHRKLTNTHMPELFHSSQPDQID